MSHDYEDAQVNHLDRSISTLARRSYWQGVFVGAGTVAAALAAYLIAGQL